MLERLQVVFDEADLPHINQTAYRKSVSCADAIFATQEVIARYLRGGAVESTCAYMTCRRLSIRKSIEYPILLKRLYEAGVDGKLWRLLKDWYEGGTGRVRLDGRLSDEFTVERGVKQG